MEGVAPAVSLFRPRASACPTIILAENSGNGRRSPGAGGNPDSRKLYVVWLTTSARVAL